MQFCQKAKVILLNSINLNIKGGKKEPQAVYKEQRYDTGDKLYNIQKLNPKML